MRAASVRGRRHLRPETSGEAMSVADIRKNRYAILVCGILTMLMFGTIYALSLIHI